MATLANLTVRVASDTSRFIRGMDKVRKTTRQTLRDTGRAMRGAGRTMTTRVTAPILAAGGAAVTFASKNRKAMKEIQAAAALTGDEMDKVEQGIENIRSTTGRSAQEIQDAMSIAQSSALGLEEANELVLTSAKASEAGFGDMRSMVNLATSASEKFGDEIGSASEALEVVIGTADQVQAQMDEFIPNFLRATGGMEQLNIGMGEGAALFGKLADAARDTNAAGTQYDALLKQLNTPQKDLKALLTETFGSMEQFRKAMGEDAIGAFETFQTAVKNSDKNLGELLGRQRAITGASNLFAGELERTNEILKKQEQRHDIIQKKFAQTDSFIRTLSIAWEELKMAIEPIGEILINELQPILTEAIGTIRRVSTAFQNLSPETQRFTLIAAGVAAAIGPVLIVLGSLAAALAALMSPIGLVIGALVGAGALVAAFVDVQAVIGSTVETFTFFKNQWQKHSETIKTLTQPLFEVWNKMKDVASTSFDIVIEAIAGVVNFLKGDWKAAWENAKNIFSEIVGFIKRSFKRVFGKEIMKVLKNFLGKGKQIFEDFKEGAMKQMEKLSFGLVGGSVIPDMVDKMINEFGRAKDEGERTFREMTSQILKQTGPLTFWGEEMAALAKKEERINFARANTWVNVGRKQRQSIRRTRSTWAEELTALSQREKEMQQARAQTWVNVQNQSQQSTNVVTQAFQSMFQSGSNLMGGLVNKVSSGLKAMMKGTKSFGEALVDIWKGIFDTIMNMIAKLIAKMAVVGIISAILPGGGGFMAGASGVLSDFLDFQTGGIVPGSPTQGKLAVVHGQEKIIPAGQDKLNRADKSMDSLTVQVEGPRAMTDLWRKLTKEIRRKQGERR